MMVSENEFGTGLFDGLFNNPGESDSGRSNGVQQQAPQQQAPQQQAIPPALLAEIARQISEKAAWSQQQAPQQSAAQQPTAQDQPSKQATFNAQDAVNKQIYSLRLSMAAHLMALALDRPLPQGQHTLTGPQLLERAEAADTQAHRASIALAAQFGWIPKTDELAAILTRRG